MRLSSVFKRAAMVASVAVAVAEAAELSATSLVSCSASTELSPSFFDVRFDPETRALYYNIVIDTNISGYILAVADVYAYGFKIITKQIDVCDLGWKQFCPIYPGSISINSVAYISEEYTKQIPGIAYSVPDIDAVARIRIMDYNGTELGCLQASFTNGKTVSHTGVRWATAVIAGLGLLASALLSTFGNSNAASHISANAVSLFLYFQNVVIVSMIHVQMLPPIASAWSENLAWSMGLIETAFMQKIFRWYIQATGGTPDLFMTSNTKSVLVQRGVETLNELGLYKRTFNTPQGSLFKRAAYTLLSNTYLEIYRGIQRLGYKSGIELTSICVTGFTWFILFAWIITGVFFIFKYSLELAFRLGWLKHRQATNFRLNWLLVLKGSLQRYIYIGFTQLVILSLWQFFQRDSAAVVFLAVVFLIFALGVIGWACFRTLSFGRQSVAKYKNPAAILYGDQRVLDKYGFFYTMFNAQKYWFGSVILGYNVVKCVFIGLGQGSGKTQALAVFILDAAFFVVLLMSAPYLNHWTNCVNYAMAAINLLNSFLFLFFSQLFGQPESVGSIMAWVFFIVNAAFSVFLLVATIYTIVAAVLSKNPDVRFAAVKDDRTAFQRKHSIKNANGQRIVTDQTAALMALGAAVQTHDNNWEAQALKAQDRDSLVLGSTEKFGDEMESHTPPVLVAQNMLDRTPSEQNLLREQGAVSSETGGILGKLSRGLSLKRNRLSGKVVTVQGVSDQGFTGDPRRVSPFDSPGEYPPVLTRGMSGTLDDLRDAQNPAGTFDARVGSYASGLTMDNMGEPMQHAEVINSSSHLPRGY